MFTTIPPITEPLGRHWEQPDHRRFLIDDKYVIMSKHDFEELPEYSCSQPSGVYPGKMWRRRVPYKDAPHHDWFLLWYDESEKGSNFCSTKIREIILL